jgi:hypothetical protein
MGRRRWSPWSEAMSLPQRQPAPTIPRSGARRPGAASAWRDRVRLARAYARVVRRRDAGHRRPGAVAWPRDSSSRSLSPRPKRRAMSIRRERRCRSGPRCCGAPSRGCWWPSLESRQDGTPAPDLLRSRQPREGPRWGSRPLPTTARRGLLHGRASERGGAAALGADAPPTARRGRPEAQDAPGWRRAVPGRRHAGPPSPRSRRRRPPAGFRGRGRAGRRGPVRRARSGPALPGAPASREEAV